MDDPQLTYATLDQLEAERKLRSIPACLLESTWTREAQVEAVVDALLVATTVDDLRAYAHARNTGEWAARIATALPCSPGAAFMRRCGVLADVDPAVLQRVPEVREYAAVVRAFQALRVAGIGEDDGVQTAALIVATAEEFDAMICAPDATCAHSPSAVLREMFHSATPESKPILHALVRAIPNAPADLSATVE